MIFRNVLIKIVEERDEGSDIEWRDNLEIKVRIINQIAYNKLIAYMKLIAY